MKQKSSSCLWKKGIALGMSFAMTATLIPAVPSYAETGGGGQNAIVKPSGVTKAGSVTLEGGVQGQPFASGTAGSKNFRAPAMMTMDDDQILAVAEADWDGTERQNGTDIIAAVSEDGGTNWKNYTFPFYFPDSDGYSADGAATFTSPAIVEGPDGKIYCFANVFPTGGLENTALAGHNHGSGYVSAGGEARYLALTDDVANADTAPSDDNRTNYAYYVGDFAKDGYAPVVRRSDNEPTEYYVDAWYNLYTKEGNTYTAKMLPGSASSVQQNVFYKNSGSQFHVYNVGYTWMVASEDRGQTWGDPKNISDQINPEGATDMRLISSGRGLTTRESGDIVLGVRSHGAGTNSKIGAGAIISTDNGKTWDYKEGVEALNTNDVEAGQNKIVELEDGTLRMFFSNGQSRICYVDAKKGANGYAFGERQTTEAVLADQAASRCNLSALAYSGKAGGKQMILVSAPKGTGRANGRIFAFLAGADNALTLADEFEIPDAGASFEYSSMAELSDGSVGILWESKAGNGYSMRYDRFSVLDIAPHQAITGVKVNVDLKVGETYRREYDGDEAPQAPAAADSDVADVKTGTTLEVQAALYDHANSGNTFSETANTDLNLMDAECVFKKDEGADAWSIYNEKTKTYFYNAKPSKDTSENYLFVGLDKLGDSNVSVIKLSKKDESAQTFQVVRKDDSSRELFIWHADINFNSGGGSSDTNATKGMILLKRKDVSDASDIGAGNSLIKGYEQVSEPKSGEKYLIVCNTNAGVSNAEKKLYLLYPVAGKLNATKNSVTKLVGGAGTQEAKPLDKFIEITAKKEGFQEFVIDDVTYRVHVAAGIEKTGRDVKLKAGETRDGGWLETHVNADTASDTVAEVKIRDSVKVTVPLYKKATINNTDKTYSTVDLGLDIEDAECIFTKTTAGENTWSIYNEKTDSYFMNAKTGTFFQKKDVVDQEGKDRILVTPEGTGADVTFKFQRYNESEHRKVFFYYAWGSFATQDKNAATPCEEGLILLQKKDTVAGDDLIKGYERVNQIEDGGKYLIACHAGDTQADTQNGTNCSTYVIYPDITSAASALGTEMTKKVGPVANQTTETGSRLAFTSKNPGCTALEIGGATYNIQVTGGADAVPTHNENILLDQGVITASCYDRGNTGDKVCKVCGETITKGTISASAHQWGNPTVTDLTIAGGVATADGSKTYTCQTCGHVKTEIIHKYAYNYLKEQTDAAQKESDDVKTKLGETLTNATTALTNKNDSIEMYKAAAALEEKLAEIAKEGCTCEITAITMDPAPIQMKADGSDNTRQISPDPTMAECNQAGHPLAPSYSYRIKDAGTTGAKVNNQGVVTAIASGKAVVEVTGTVNGKSLKQDVAITVIREGQTIEGCVCNITSLEVQEGTTVKIELDGNGAAGAHTVTLHPDVTVAANGCKISGHPGSNTQSVSYRVKDAGATGATVDANGTVTVAQAGMAVVTVTAKLACGATKSLDVTVIATSGELPKAGSVSGTDETVTKSQPFDGEIAGRKYFDDPSLIVKEKGAGVGMLVAAADAKYDTAVRRAGGMDIVASVSSDNGANWTYSFPIRFPDSDANAKEYSTTANNPALVEGADGKIYCLANVNPTGVTAMAGDQEGYIYPKAGTGYIEIEGQKRLALTSDYANANTNPAGSANGVYEYYVGDFTEGMAPVMKRSDNTESEYAVDEWYNLYQKATDGYEALTQMQATATGAANGGSVVQQNVFYAGSDLHVYNTGYIMCVTSQDGVNWADPVILNPLVKQETEQALLVASGKGLRTSPGRLVIPVYGRNEDTADAGSIIWLDTQGNWKRAANNIPATELITASSDGEIVEISNGHLRMLFRNKTGLVCYADARRNAQDIFEFSDPVATGTAMYPDVNVTAVKYPKTVDGRQAILAAASSGNALANGQIFTFLGRDDENKSIVRTEQFTVPNSASYYGDSCLVLQDGGNQLGLLWQNSNGKLRYSRFGITEVVNGYIPDITVDVNLTVGGEPYTRTYTVEGQSHLNGVTQAPTPSGIASYDFDAGQAETVTVPALYRHSGTGAVFENDPDADSDITKAEFTITRPSNQEENTYLVYSEGEARYLSNKNSENDIFTAGFENYMQITPVADEGTFAIVKAGATRKLLFDKQNCILSAATGNVSDAYTNNFTLLEKLPEASEDADETQPQTEADGPVAGYKTVTEITPGRKYLIAHIAQDDKVYVVYPRNTFREGIRKVEGTREVNKKATKRLTITAIKEGEATMVANDVTYRITCVSRTIEMQSKARRFFKGATLDNSYTGDATVASLEEGTFRNNALYDRVGNQDRDLSAYAAEGVTDLNEIDLSRAEFMIEEEGEGYTLYNQATRQYLRNNSGSDWFGSAKQVMQLTKDGDNASFKIHRAANDGNQRYVIYYYPWMAFDGWGSALNDNTAANLEFLEKQDIVTDTDDIPGYRRVDKITSGKSYLITEYYEKDGRNVIFVMYPNRSATGQSKMFEITVDNGVWLVAKGREGQTVTNLKVGNVTYNELSLTAPCDHSGAKVIYSGYKAPSCTQDGATGTGYCLKCYGDKVESTVINKLGHDTSGEWTIDKEVTLDEDGQKSTTCLRCGEKVTETISSEEFVTSELAKEIAKAETILANASDYDATSISGLQEALTAAKELGNDATIEQKRNAVKALQAINPRPSSEFAEKKAEFTSLFDELNAHLEDTDTYSAAELAKLQAALDEIKPVEEYLTKADLQAAIKKLQDAKDALKTKEEEALEQKRKEVTDALNDVKSILDQANSPYSDESLANLRAVYNKYQNADLTGKTQTELEGIKKEITDAKNALETKEFAAQKKTLADLIEEAEENLTKTDVYTSDSLAKLREALNEVESVTVTPANVAGLIQKLENVELVTLADQEEADKKAENISKIKEALPAAKALVDAGQGDYTNESWAEFTKAYEALNLSDEELNALTSDKLKELLDALTVAQEGLKKKDNGNSGDGGAAEKAKNEALKAADDALKTVAGKINVGTDASKYTSDSWNAFLKAYNALKGLTDAQKKNMTALQLKTLADNLKNAYAKLVPVTYVTSVQMAYKTYSIVKGKSVNLSKEIVSKNPQAASNQTLTWKSSNTKVATVTPAGVVKTNKKAAKKSAKITAVNGAGQTVATVTVKVMNGSVSKVKAKGKTKLAVKAGKNVTLKATVKTKGKKPINNKLKWTSSDAKTATVTTKLGTSMKVKIAKNAKKGKKVKITATSTDGTNKKVVFTITVKK